MPSPDEEEFTVKVSRIDEDEDSLEVENFNTTRCEVTMNPDAKGFVSLLNPGGDFDLDVEVAVRDGGDVTVFLINFWQYIFDKDNDDAYIFAEGDTQHARFSESLDDGSYFMGVKQTGGEGDEAFRVEYDVDVTYSRD